MKSKLTLIEKLRLKLAVKSKCKKFQRNGYLEISPQEIENYLLQYRWERMQFKNFRHQLDDAHSFSINDFFDYQQVKIQTTSQKLADLEDFSDLF